MSKLESMYIGLDADKKLVIQESSYIEDGIYIRELICGGGFEIMSIPQYGGKESVEGVYLTLKETLCEFERMKTEYS